MSWLARSIANSLKLDDDEEDEHTNPNADATDPKSLQKSIPEADQHHHQPDSPSLPSNQSPRGIKEDLSKITKTLTRQLWGVTFFLAPPPPPEPEDLSKITKKYSGRITHTGRNRPKRPKHTETPLNFRWNRGLCRTGLHTDTRFSIHSSRNGTEYTTMLQPWQRYYKSSYNRETQKNKYSIERTTEIEPKKKKTQLNRSAGRIHETTIRISI